MYNLRLSVSTIPYFFNAYITEFVIPREESVIVPSKSKKNVSYLFSILTPSFCLTCNLTLIIVCSSRFCKRQFCVRLPQK